MEQNISLQLGYGETSSYETNPLFPIGLPDDDLDLLFPVRIGDLEFIEDLDLDGLLLLDGDLALSTRGETRDLDTSTGERLRLWMGLRLRTGLRLRL